MTTGAPFSTKSKRNEAIGRAIDEMRAKTQQQAKHQAGGDSSGGGAQKRWQQAFETLRSKVDAIKQRFEQTVENRIDPTIAAKAQQVSDQIRSVFSKQFLDDVAGDLFQRKKQYGRNSAAANSDLPANGDVRDVAVVRKPEGAFARRLRQIRERVQQTDAYKKVEGQFTVLSQKVRESPVYQKGVEVQAHVGDKIEDARDAYETTQNPLVLTMRDAGDSLFSESDQAAAMAALRRLDPAFSLDDLMDELEHYMIPNVIKAYLRADTDVLHDVCGGDALAFVNASVRQRQAQNAHYDERILDVNNLAFHDAITLESGDPVLVVTFCCQHVHCVRGPDGAIVEGSDHDIRTTIYSWALARDHTSTRFNWRILDMQVQGIRALI